MMYFDTKGFVSGCKGWLAILKYPIYGELILGIQGAHNEKADPVFTALKDAWAWKISSGFDLFFKPIVLLLILAWSVVLTLLKLGFMLCILPIWLFMVFLWNINSGLPAYEQSWVCPHD